MKRRLITVAVLAFVQLLLVGLAVAPRLSAYTRGDEYVVRTAPVDPIDPFRGAYVTLRYPGIEPAIIEEGAVFFPLEERPNGTWVPGRPTTDRPDEPPYLACESSGYDVSCGIESYFADQEEAARLGRELADGGLATLRIDDRGNAVVIGVSPRPPRG